MNRRLALGLALALAGAACGGSAADQRATLTVLAASSLSGVFPRIAGALEDQNETITVRFSFAGTDALATQVEQGAPADVFAAASIAYTGRLWDRGLVGRPRLFATNRVVLVVPSSNPAAISSVRDLTRPGVRLVIGSGAVPIGEYTRTVLTQLDALYGHGYADAVLANVASEEMSVESVLTKVRLGEADAGFVYFTDAHQAGADVRSFDIPVDAEVIAHYSVAVVVASTHPEQAEQLVAFLLGPTGQRFLMEAGFGPPPAT